PQRRIRERHNRSHRERGCGSCRRRGGARVPPSRMPARAAEVVGGRMTRSTRSKVVALACLRCGADHDVALPLDSRGCPRCQAEAPSNVAVRYAQEALAARGWKTGDGRQGLARYADFLPVAAEELTTLGEGDTPLIPATRLGASLGLTELYLKDEGRNPTWS